MVIPMLVNGKYAVMDMYLSHKDTVGRLRRKIIRLYREFEKGYKYSMMKNMFLKTQLFKTSIEECKRIGDEIS